MIQERRDSAILWISGVDEKSPLGQQVASCAAELNSQLSIASEASGPEQLERFAAADDSLDAVLLGPDLSRPLILARHARQVSPLVQVVFLCSPEGAARLRKEMQLVPMIGTYWNIVELDNAPLLPTIDEAVRSTRQRRQLQRTLSRINTRLSARLEIDTDQYDRLLVSDRFLASILDHADDAIISVAPDGRILTWNRAATMLLGRSENDALGRPIDLLFYDHQVSALRELLGAARSRGHAGRREFVCRRPDGSTADVEMTFAPVHAEQRTATAVSIIARDVSDRKRSEEQLRTLNAELEQRVAERTAVAEKRAAQLRRLASELTQTEQRERKRLAQLLHDELQQLMVAAKMRLAMVLPRIMDEQLRGPLAQADDLIRQSLETSRTLTTELSPSILQDAGLPAAMQWLARWMQEKHGLTVDVEVEDATGPDEWDVRILLFEIVRELLFNVAKHAGTDRAHLRLVQPEENRVRIVVEDRGVGFDKRAAAAQEASSSFGLFSIRERLQLIGGSIMIRTEPGSGTHVAVEVPIHPTRPTRHSPKLTETPTSEFDIPVFDENAQSPGRLIRVMLVDDHAVVRQGLASILRGQAGIQLVGEAADGQAAVELARELRPDVIVMDISMPRMSGIEATRIIRGELPYVRIVGLSLHEQKEMAHEMLSVGADRYLSKGGPADELIAAIRDGAS